MSTTDEGVRPGAWFRVDDGLPDHAKTRRLARLLRVPVEHAVGIVVCLWARVSRTAADGVLEGFDFDTLSDLVGVDGAGQALAAAGFLDLDADGRPRALHGWMARNERSKSAQRTRKWRERKRGEAAPVTAGDGHGDVTVMAYVNTSRLVDPPKEDPSPEGVQGEVSPPLLPVEPEPGPDVATPERVFAAYNATLAPAGWTRHQRLTRDLRPKLAARIRELAERRSLAWWVALFERIAVRVTWPSSKTLEFVVRTDGQLQGFVDGSRDDRPPPAPRARQHPPSVAQQLFARAAAVEAGMDLGPDPLAGVMLTLPDRRQGYVGRAPPVAEGTLELSHGEAPEWAPGGDA